MAEKLRHMQTLTSSEGLRFWTSWRKLRWACACLKGKPVLKCRGHADACQQGLADLPAMRIIATPIQDPTLGEKSLTHAVRNSCRQVAAMQCKSAANRQRSGCSSQPAFSSQARDCLHSDIHPAQSAQHLKNVPLP